MSWPAIGIEDTRPTKPCQKFEGHTGWVRDVIHLPDGQQIMTCSWDGSLGVWNLQTGKHIANWQDGESAVHSMALSVDGKRVVSGSHDGLVRLWNMETGKVLAKWTGHTDDVWSVCWNRNDERVLSGSEDGTARVWDVETGNTIIEINTGLDVVYTATFSPDSTLIATGGDSSEDEFIKIWDTNTGKLVAILKGHTRVVFCLAWTADGRTLISGFHNQDLGHFHLAAARSFEGPLQCCPWHCNISKWLYPRECTIRPHSTIVEPPEWPAHRVAPSASRGGGPRVVFHRWNTTSHWMS